MLKIILPILVLAVTFAYTKHLKETAPEAKKRPFVQRLPVVEVETLEPTSYTVNIAASGTVKAGTQTDFVAEASGRIVRISNDFLEGSYFEKEQTLLEIDDSNYLNAVDIAESDVTAGEANLKQIKAEEESNKRSIKLAQQNLLLGKKELTRVKTLLGKKLISRSLVDAEDQKINQLQQKLQDLKGIQTTYASRINATQASINSSKARLKQATLDLSRTKIKAPYSGRVLIKNVDVGQYVSIGTVLGNIYATDFVNIELPLSLNQYELLGMPEAFKNKSIKTNELPEVTLTNPDSFKNDKWFGRVVRTSAALDAQSRQINVIVRVDNPYEAKEGISTPIRIGQYLNAVIKGRTFHNVFVLPSNSVVYNREIRILDDGKIRIEPVNVLWNSNNETVIEANPLFSGKQIIITNLAQAIDGMKAITIAQQKAINKNKTIEKKNKKNIEDKNSNAKKNMRDKKNNNENQSNG